MSCKIAFGLLIAAILALSSCHNKYARRCSHDDHVKSAEKMISLLGKDDHVHAVIERADACGDHKNWARIQNGRLYLLAPNGYTITRSNNSYTINNGVCNFVITYLTKFEADDKSKLDSKSAWLTALSCMPLDRARLEKMSCIEIDKYIEDIFKKQYMMYSFDKIYSIGKNTILLCSYITHEFDGRIWLDTGEELIVCGRFSGDFEPICSIMQTIQYADVGYVE